VCAVCFVAPASTWQWLRQTTAEDEI